MRVVNNVTAFYTIGDAFSNWYPASFKMTFPSTLVQPAREYIFNCAEQAMMAFKAYLFGDVKTFDKIMATDDPGEQKRLGRQVKNYDERVWAKMRIPTVTNIRRAQYKQNPEMKQVLLDTGDTIIVEASKTDLLWGAGVAEWEEDIAYPERWPGKNFLGKIHMVLRDEFRTEIEIPI